MYLAAILSGFPFSSSNSFTKTCDFGFPHLRPGIWLSYLKQYWADQIFTRLYTKRCRYVYFCTGDLIN